MLRRFLIKLPESNLKCAVFSYDTETKQFAIDIPDDIDPNNLPAIPRLLFDKGMRHIDDYWARRFVKERIAPPERQNIGSIMRIVGIKEYDEFEILIYCDGRSSQDDFILEEIKE